MRTLVIAATILSACAAPRGAGEPLDRPSPAATCEEVAAAAPIEAVVRDAFDDDPWIEAFFGAPRLIAPVREALLDACRGSRLTPADKACFVHVTAPVEGPACRDPDWTLRSFYSGADLIRSHVVPTRRWALDAAHVQEAIDRLARLPPQPAPFERLCRATVPIWLQLLRCTEPVDKTSIVLELAPLISDTPHDWLAEHETSNGAPLLCDAATWKRLAPRCF